MTLKDIRIQGYKCFVDSGKIPVHSLTVFIGENDAGKSSVLTCIGLLLNNANVKAGEFHSNLVSGDVVDQIVIDGTLVPFNPDDDNLIDLLNNGQIELRRTIQRDNSSKYFLNKEVYNDERLNNISNQVVITLKELCRGFNLDETGKKADLIDRLNNYIAQTPQPKRVAYVEVSWRSLSDIVPIYQRFSSSDYGNPHLLIGKVLSNVYRNHFYESNADGTGEVLSESYTTLKREIENSLDTKIQETLKGVIQRYNPNVQEVKGIYDIDFGRGLNFSQLEIDTGSGLKPINNRGEGAKKRLFLSILEWDKILQQQLEVGRGIIKAYDEPDANLHFSAQRRLFYAIQSDSDNNQHVQSIVCTHALTMIDRAPALCINCLVPNDEEISTVTFLEADEDDEDIQRYLSQVSEISGLQNSSIFYEKCFLLVEGPSEENCLPVLYRKRYSRSMAEDGVVLINLHSNGAWRNYLKLLKKNKENLTILLLDSDTQYETSTASITKDRLIGIGYSEAFLHNNVLWAGRKEFEDTYDSTILHRTMNQCFPRHDGSDYTLHDVEAISNDEPEKYSEDLRVYICQHHRSWVGKPEVALKYAECITKEEIENWNVIVRLFDKIQEIII